jgi:hypothetical protein
MLNILLLLVAVLVEALEVFLVVEEPEGTELELKQQ